MAKHIVFADAHVGRYSEFNDTPLKRFERCLLALQQMFQYAVVHNVSLIVDAGDLLEEKNKIDFPIYNSFLSFLKSWANQPGFPPILSLAGNHNWASLSEDVSNLTPLAGPLTPVLAPTWLEVGGIGYFLMPYRRDHSKWQQEYAALPWENRSHAKYNVLVAHQGLEGARVGTSRYVVSEGDGLKFDENLCDINLFGHYHLQQRISSRTWYVGALLQQNFSECGNPQGFWVLDTDTLQWSWHPVDVPAFFTVESPSQVDTVNFFRVESPQPVETFKQMGAPPNVRVELVQTERKPLRAHMGSMAELVADYVAQNVPEQIQPEVSREIGSIFSTHYEVHK